MIAWGDQSGRDRPKLIDGADRNVEWWLRAEEPMHLDLEAPVHHHSEASFIGDPGGLPGNDAELEPEALRARRHGLLRVRRTELAPAEDVDDVDRSGGLDRFRERRERLPAMHLALVRVHRHAVEAAPEEVANHVVRGPLRPRRRADDGNPRTGLEERPDRRVVEQLDGSAPLRQVEVRDRAAPVLGRQVVASRWYGWPSAAGGMLRPTTPARTTIVTR